MPSFAAFLSCGLLLVACTARPGPEGRWTYDPKPLAATLGVQRDAELAKTPAEQRDALRTQWEARITAVSAVRGELRIAADGTYEIEGSGMTEGAGHAKGKWSLDASTVLFQGPWVGGDKGDARTGLLRGDELSVVSEIDGHSASARFERAR